MANDLWYRQYRRNVPGSSMRRRGNSALKCSVSANRGGSARAAFDIRAILIWITWVTIAN